MTVSESLSKLKVVKIQRFSTHDGPGVRTVVFLAGCPLHCAWCHNPEAQSPQKLLSYKDCDCIGCSTCVALCKNGVHSFEGENHLIERAKCAACGTCIENCPTGAVEPTFHEMSIDEILTEVMKDKAFYGEIGGITLSGGEPMMHGKSAIELLKAAKERGISTAVETCGYFDSKYAEELGEYADFLLWDLKDMNDERHIRYTGVSNRKIIENLFLTDKTARSITLRCIMVSGVNMDDGHLCAVAETAKHLRHFSGVELIPYHPFGSSKNAEIGREVVSHREWIPTKEQIARSTEVLGNLKCKTV